MYMSRHRLAEDTTMASVETAWRTGQISPRFEKLLKDVVDDLNPEELKYAVSSIKTNFEKGKFADKGDQDLFSCLHLFANQGLVSEDNLTLLEKFVVTPQTSKKEGIEAKIKGFKAIRLQEIEESTAATRRELTGRISDLASVMSKLTTGGSSVLNLYGSSGVGKTRLATEVLSKWQGAMKFKVDLREIEKMEDVHFHVLQALSIGSKETTVSYEANPVIFKMRQLRQGGRGNILLLLDNVDQFSGGNGDAAASLNTNFVSFLQRIISDGTGREKSTLKILLTSRSAFRHGVDNYEVGGLEKVSSEKLLQSHGTPAILGNQRERLVEMCKGKPLLLNGMASILRQEIADAEKLLGTIEQELEVEQTQDTGDKEIEKKETFDVKEEGIDEKELSCLRKMFFFLPSKTLKESAVSVSLFCRPFSLEAAAKILGVNVSEAAIRMEGMRNSQVISVVPEAKELSYDIHPLMRKFLKSIGNSKVFVEAYQKAKDNFCKHFISQLTTISALLDKEYVKAFDSFDFEKPNFELALEISLKSNYLLIPRQHRESVMICYLFEAMLGDQKQRRKIFHAWAEKVEEDGNEGSMFRAEMRCWEALQVLNLEGWRKAVEVVQEARELLERVQRESKKTELFKLAKSSCLFVEGEVFNRAGNWPKALKRLSRSLEIMQDQLKSHTSTCRCLNAIGNCYSNLGKPEEAIKFYTRAFEMRQELSGSMKHFDFPLFKSQIGTAYESMAIQEYNKLRMTPEAKKNFRKAIEYYQEALDLAKELKLTGILYTALYNRNIANAHSWLMEFEKAKTFAYNGYQIRKDILGKHPLTARSTFQMAEISRSLEDFDEAEEYYEEAWEIEKSLGQGNHSEVRDRIIKSYEGMLPRERKRAFQKEVLEFYQRSWDEEKRFEGFQFSQANMKIIDSIEERLGEEADVKTRRKYQSEALWFYEGAWNSPDTKRLPYDQREHILQTLLRLCKVAKNKELFEKYQKDSFRFYEKRWKKNRSELAPLDRIDLLTTLENLATSLGYARKAEKYKTLLQKSRQGTSFSWRSLNPFTGAGKSPDDDDDDDDDYDSSNDDDDRIDDNFNENEDSDGGAGGGADAGDDDDGDENDTNMGLGEGDEITEEQELPQQIHELSLEGQVEDMDEPDSDKTKIYEETLTSEGTHWALKRGGAHIFFPPNAVSEPTSIVVHRWKCSACSPSLQEHEVIVSNVIEISAITLNELEFDAEVKLVLSHSAPDLQGYELVIKRLIDKESNEWEEVDGTEDLRCLQDIENDYPHQLLPDFSFPVAQADITECSTYAVVCRLKSSPSYTITSNGGSFSHPDYPGVTITVPKKAVPQKAKFSLELKVQEVPSEEFEGQDVFFGPVLRITCSQHVEFLKPVTIQLPVSLQSHQEGITDLSTCRVRVLFLRSDVQDKKWTEITDDLRNPVNFNGTFVKFQVERFSGYACVFDWHKEDMIVPGIVINYLSSLIWKPPMLAVFFAYFEQQDRAHSQDVLHLICCPAHLREKIIQELEKRNVVPSEGNSKKKLIPGHDKAFVFVSGGISPVDFDDMEDFHLMFESNYQYTDQLPVRLINDKILSRVEFRSSPDPKAKNLLSKLNFRLSSLKLDCTKTPVEFFGVPLNDPDLQNADPLYVLAACKPFLSPDTYEEHSTHLKSGHKTPEQVLRSLMKAVAGLDSKYHDECFKAIVDSLREASEEGFSHVIKRLQEGELVFKIAKESSSITFTKLARDKVITPLKEKSEVIRKVSERVESSWRKLARHLDLKEGKIGCIAEEEKDDEERCYKILRTWCELNGNDATVRKLMIRLTNIGKAEVNNDIMRCLKLVKPDS